MYEVCVFVQWQRNIPDLVWQLIPKHQRQADQVTQTPRPRHFPHTRFLWVSGILVRPVRLLLPTSRPSISALLLLFLQRSISQFFSLTTFLFLKLILTSAQRSIFPLYPNQKAFPPHKHQNGSFTAYVHMPSPNNQQSNPLPSEQLRTITTDLLKIPHPVLLAGMNVAAGPKLAAAVTNAGGLGVIGGVGYTPDMLREQIAELKSYLNDKNAPFGVDLLLPQVGGSARKTK